MQGRNQYAKPPLSIIIKVFTINDGQTKFDHMIQLPPSQVHRSSFLQLLGPFHTGKFSFERRRRKSTFERYIF